MASGDIGIPAEMRDEAARMQIALIAMKRIVRPEEISSAALFLASDESAFFTGGELCPRRWNPKISGQSPRDLARRFANATPSCRTAQARAGRPVSHRPGCSRTDTVSGGSG
jgi:NAD(P)-dependent dehydrogenase (short-subunit alcohol dehydrogenase family)